MKRNKNKNKIKRVWQSLGLLGFIIFYMPTAYSLNNAYAATYTQGIFSDTLAQQKEQANNQTGQSIQRFQDSVEIIREMYVDQLADSKIFDKALVGLMAQLDPHSEYLDEEGYQALTIATSGEFVGIGAEVTMNNKEITVVSPLDDSPAQKAGIQPGDVILKINDTPMQGLSLDQAIKLIRGQPGTELSLTIVRKGQEKPLILKLVRAEIKVVSVKSQLLDGHYGYIRISSFQSTTAKDLHQAIDQLLASSQGKLRGVVLDLRNNPGGLLPASIEVADAFLDLNPGISSGINSADNKNHGDRIVSTKGRTEDSDFKGFITPGDRMAGVPVVALINQGSASASEIVAAALQDHRRAVIMGERSFGKGSVQTVMSLPDGKTGLKITTARFYSPSGRPIQGEGVTPDVQVEALTLDQASNDRKTLGYRETNLSNALVPERPDLASVQDAPVSTQVKTQTQTQIKAQGADLSTDYQLNAALNLLKGLYVLKGS